MAPGLVNNSTPWKLEIPKEKIDKLKQKLELTDLPDEVESEWGQGPPLSEIKRLVNSWKSFDYTNFQAEINAELNYKIPIHVEGFGDLNIHFIHEPHAKKDAIPLLFVHGWPGSFLEALKIKRLLAESPSSAPDFHFVALSLPNFGFSDGVKKPGFGLSQYAEVCNKLMLSLGYNKYATQAGDWGYWITRATGFKYPDHCLASHYNMPMAQAPRWSQNPLLALQHAITPLSQFELRGQERSEWFANNSRGYNYLQSTRPQTLGYSLADSPIGLLSWIYEKLHDWTDNYPWTDQELITFASVYYFSTAGPAAPQRIYYEVGHEKDQKYTYQAMFEWMPQVKLGLAFNPKELENSPKLHGRSLGNVVYEVENEHGGHFYAHEHPEWLVRDLHKMFGKDINAFGL